MISVLVVDTAPLQDEALHLPKFTAINYVSRHCTVASLNLIWRELMAIVVAEGGCAGREQNSQHRTELTSSRGVKYRTLQGAVNCI